MMISIRVVLAGALVAVLSLAASPVFATAIQAEGSTTEAAAPPPLPGVLRAGSIWGALTATPLDGRYADGTSAFAQLLLSTETAAKRGIDAELVLDIEHGEIVGVSGSGVEGEQDGARYLARIGGVRQGRDRAVLIEVRLRAVEGNPPNRLNLTLRAPGTQQAGNDGNEDQEAKGGEASVSLAWPVADCTGSYHSALRDIGGEKGNKLREIWRAAARPEKGVSRDWYFKPSLPKRTPRRRKADPEVTASIPGASEREIFLEAGRLLRNGYDPALGRNGRYSMTLSKTSNDLKRYLSQGANPAICTGADVFTNYYEEKLAPLGERFAKLAALSIEARQLAKEKSEAAVEAARDLPEGHPGWGGATLAALRPVQDRSGDLKAAVVDLLEATGFPEEVLIDVRDADDAYEALRILDVHGLGSAELPKTVQAALRQALSAIEAAVRLEMFAERHAGFWGGFHGSLEAIREAHRKNCICDG